MELEMLKASLKKNNSLYQIVESEDNNKDYVNFLFVGIFEGKEVIYDVLLYTLRLHYESELMDIATHKAANKFPNFKPIILNEDENGDLEILDEEQEEIGLYIAETMDELDDDGFVKVKEHLELEVLADEVVSIEVALNIEEVNHKAILKFIKEYNDDTLVLSENVFSPEMD